MDVLAARYPNVITESYKKEAAARIGKICCDCSGLPAWYTRHNIGSAQLYAQAYTRLSIANIKDFAIGTILWKSGHVGVYIGLENGIPMCVEAKGIAYGTVKTKVSNNQWKYGLTFSWLTYSYTRNLVSTATWKGTNPYQEPSKIVYYDSKNKKIISIGNDAKWVQWELVEAGSEIIVDGKFGPKSDAALRSYQTSCKITVDGKCGPITRKYLKAV